MIFKKIKWAKQPTKVAIRENSFDESVPDFIVYGKFEDMDNKSISLVDYDTGIRFKIPFKSDDRIITTIWVDNKCVYVNSNAQKATENKQEIEPER